MDKWNLHAQCTCPVNPIHLPTERERNGSADLSSLRRQGRFTEVLGGAGAALAPRSRTSSLPALATNAPPAHLLNASRPCRCFSLPSVSFHIVYEKKCLNAYCFGQVEPPCPMHPPGKPDSSSYAAPAEWICRPVKSQAIRPLRRSLRRGFGGD